jgi:Family of unknown function (DUF6445)
LVEENVIELNRSTDIMTWFDDFYRSPDIVREIAISGEFVSNSIRFVGEEWCCDRFPMNGVFEHLAGLLGFPLCARRNSPARFRLLTAEQFCRRIRQVHVDRNGLACVLSLSYSFSGDKCTSFYRHRRTGLTGVSDRSELRRVALAEGISVNNLIASLEEDGSTLSCWEQIYSIENSFNRLVVFDSNLFHRAADGFGRSLVDGRLTQVFQVWPYCKWRIDQHLLFGYPFSPTSPVEP